MRYEFDHEVQEKGSYVFKDALKPYIADIDDPSTDEGESLDYDINIKWYMDITQTKYKLERYIGVSEVILTVSGELAYFGEDDKITDIKEINEVIKYDNPDKINIEFNHNGDKEDGVTEEYSVDALDFAGDEVTVYF